MDDAVIIDGKAIANNLRSRISKQVQQLKDYEQITPCLAVVMVGENEASEIYVKNKMKMTEDCGIKSLIYRRDADITQEQLLTLVHSLNENKDVNGVLIQLPLPDHIDPDTVMASVVPEKDVDGFHIVNSGLLAIGSRQAMVPCTPLGCLIMLKERFDGDLTGKRVVVIGRSKIVGKPLSSLLLNEHCTVTTVHSKTIDIASECQRADILIAAAGVPHMVKADWIKPGAVVLDVGINRIEENDGEGRLVGDVDFDAAREVAGAITPVPGGVGPMTIACLLANTVKACCRQHKVEMPTVK